MMRRRPLPELVRPWGSGWRGDPSAWVALRGLNLNPGLVVYLRGWVVQGELGDGPPSRSPTNDVVTAGRQWRVRDRLSEAQVRQLVEAFQAGTPKHELAERYGISLSSVKRLLRLYQARQQDEGQVTGGTA
jgi:hypothetical protein